VPARLLAVARVAGVLVANSWACLSAKQRCTGPARRTTNGRARGKRMRQRHRFPYAPAGPGYRLLRPDGSRYRRIRYVGFDKQRL